MSENRLQRQVNKHRVLSLLLVVYTFNFLDRQIIGILAAPIKAELELTDTQLGLLGGLAFALFYAGLGIVVAWLADRKSRVWIMTIALALWSAFTALCGLATTFTQLFLCRMGVGIGEAGGVSPAHSLISDYFPKHERGRALAIYSFGIPIGSAIGIAFGGFVASQISWRAAFVYVGIAGLLFSFVLRPLIPDPPRGQYDAPTARTTAAGLGEVMRMLATKPSFWHASLGASFGSVAGYGVLFWLPSFFVRSYGLSLQHVALFFGGILLFGGMIGIWTGGFLSDKLGHRGLRYYLLVPALGFLLAGPAYALAMQVASSSAGFVLFLIAQVVSLAWFGPVIATVQQLVPPTMRSTASAVLMFLTNLIGIGGGTVFLGGMSDWLTPHLGAEGLRYAILLGLAFYPVGGMFLLLGSRRVEKDWEG